MTIEEISNEQFVEVVLRDLETPIHMLRDLVYPYSAKIYYYGLTDRDFERGYRLPSFIPMYRFIGDEFNLTAREGDFCRIVLQYQYRADHRRQITTGFFMWEGIVTREVLEYSGCRIGANYRGVLFEKCIKKNRTI